MRRRELSCPIVGLLRLVCNVGRGHTDSLAFYLIAYLPGALVVAVAEADASLAAAMTTMLIQPCGSTAYDDGWAAMGCEGRSRVITSFRSVTQIVDSGT